MNLEAHVAPELARLKLRLAREGLRDLQELEYNKYLRTALWDKIKKWILERDRFRCTVCRFETPKQSAFPMEVHHRSYEIAVLEGKCEEALVCLCARCHDRIEFFPDRTKRYSTADKDLEYLRLQRLHRDIEADGLSVSINRSLKRKRVLLDVHYSGKQEYLEFYDLTGLMLSFVLKLSWFDGRAMSLPHRFGMNALVQDAGVVIKDAKSKGRLVHVKCRPTSAQVAISATCRYPIIEILAKAIEEKPYWHMITL